MFRFLFNPRYPLFLLIAFVIYAALWAIKPYNFSNWLLENVLTFIAVAFLVWSYRRLQDEMRPLLSAWLRESLAHRRGTNDRQSELFDM